VIVEQSPAGADRQHILQFMTTEHFTLQTARAVANAEISSRLQLYLTTVSSSIIALALVAQLSELGRAFRAFALVLLPVVYFLGGRDPGTRAAGQRRVAHLRAGNEPHPPLLPGDRAADGTLLHPAGHRRSHRQLGSDRHPQQGPVGGIPHYRPSGDVVINSVLAGVFTGLGWRSVAGQSGPVLPAILAAVGFVLSMVVLGVYEQRVFRRQLEAQPVAFPTPPDQRIR
jgi:hypothetical protein